MPASSGTTETSKSVDELAQRIRELSAEFAATLRDNVSEMRNAWTDLPRSEGPSATAPGILRMHEIAHSLAGTGKSLGFPRISQTAAPLDSLFRLLQEKDSPLNDEEVEQIDFLITDLEQAVDVPGEQVVLDNLSTSQDTRAHRGLFHILLFGTLDSETETLSVLKDTGYELCPVKADEAPPEELLSGDPAVILASLPDVAEARTWLMKCGLGDSVPVVAVGEHGGFPARLEAVQHGAADYLFTPFDRDDVFARMSAFEDRQTAPPLRVVIAEDDTTLAQFYKLTLEHAGMDAHIVSRPEDMLNELASRTADIILMDLYLGPCTGLELAQIVRQFPAYTTVPILFLSTESRITLQLEARHLGADDFLVKPLKPSQLVSAVTSRAQRYRDLKKLTDRDSLTGLLNHTNILRALEREISAAARTKTHVVMAMVDIDYFKKVNDTYGHSVGDQVLLRVSQLLRNRLRRVDHVGRYGGEEFAVVMPNTDIERATSILEELRKTCESIVYETESGPFSVTFSAGVASFPSLTTGMAISQAADACLYEAKNTGRNRIVAYTE